MDPIAAATLWGAGRLEIVLVRHGQPVPPDARDPADWDDPPLTALGMRQAEAVAAAFPAGSIDAVYTSDLRRARSTADVVSAAHTLPSVALPELREVALPDTGSPPPAVPAALWERAGQEFLASGRWTSFLAPEVAGGFRSRVRETFDGFGRRHGTGERIMVVCHSGVINRYLADVLSIERDYFFRPLHTSFARVWRDAGRTVLHSLNETAHLDADMCSG